MNTKPHILIIGPGYPYRNGPALYLSHLSHQLSSDFKVTLINYTLLYPGFLFPGKTQFDYSKKAINYPNVRLVNSMNPFTWIKTARYINKLQPDVVAFDWWHPFLAICFYGIITLLNRDLKKKVLFITENVISHERNKTDRMLTNMALSRAKAFLALSDSVKKHLSQSYDTKIFMSELPIYDIYKNDNNPGNDYRKQFGYKNDDIVLLFFGLVREYKGLDILLYAFAECVKENRNLKLLVAGEFYENPERYYKIVKETGIQDNLIIENRYIPNEEVEKYVSAADVIVLPYKSATQSGVLNVAYGFYKPVIVTDTGELRLLVDECKTGVVADKADIKSIREGIKQFLKLKELNTPFENNIKEYIAVKHTFRQVNSVFKKIADYFS